MADDGKFDSKARDTVDDVAVEIARLSLGRQKEASLCGALIGLDPKQNFAIGSVFGEAERDRAGNVTIKSQSAFEGSNPLGVGGADMIVDPSTQDVVLRVIGKAATLVEWQTLFSAHETDLVSP